MAGRGGMYCVIPGCKNSSYRYKTLSWHSFPVDESLHNMWVNRIITYYGLTALNLKKNSKVCSDHFTEIDYRPLLHCKKKLLKPGVYPSIFPPLLATNLPSKENKGDPIIHATDIKMTTFQEKPAIELIKSNSNEDELVDEPQAGEAIQIALTNEDVELNPCVNKPEVVNFPQFVTKLAIKLGKPAPDFSQPDPVIEACSTSVSFTTEIVAKHGSPISVVEESCSNSSVLAEHRSVNSEIVTKHGSPISVVEESCSNSSVLAEHRSVNSEIVTKHGSPTSVVAEPFLNRSEGECKRCKELEEQLSRLHLVLAQKDSQIEELKHGKLDVELKYSTLQVIKEKWKFYAQKQRKQLLNNSFLKGNPEICSFSPAS